MSETLPVLRRTTPEGFALSVSAENDFSGIGLLPLDGLGALAGSDDPGYLVLPRGESGCKDYCLFYFSRHTEDFSCEIQGCNIPCFGVKTAKGAFLAIITGMSWDYSLKVERKNGEYYCYPVFSFVGVRPYEDPCVEYFALPAGWDDYSGMARRYRAWKMEHHGMRPLSERAAERPELDYAKDSILIRIRCGWKPAPAKVLHQTPENEPPMHVACDFDRVSDILDELYAQGVRKAEISLVGWNVRGHDGRWPQIFPVEPALGGEEKLRALIRKGQSMGYAMTCHTNSTDQYEIADIYDAENTRRDPGGAPVVNNVAWSGGEMYQLCPRQALAQAEELLPGVAELGFRGLHYIDVVGIVPPRSCSHPDHPVNHGEAVELAAGLARLSAGLFGGFSTEAALDFIAPYTDYGLYISFDRNSGFLCDQSIPFWQLVFHGCVLSNPYSDTVNPTFKDRDRLLRLLEYGGRPTYYFYCAFMDNGNHWMGTAEPRADDDETLRTSVARIREGYETDRQLACLHTAFMDRHEEVEPGVFEVTYSNGKVLRVDYNRMDWSLR